MYAALSDRFVSFCTCKETGLPPICDGSHRKLEGNQSDDIINKFKKNEDVK